MFWRPLDVVASEGKVRAQPARERRTDEHREESDARASGEWWSRRDHAADGPTFDLRPEGRAVRLNRAEGTRRIHDAGRDAAIWILPRGPLASLEESRAMIRSVLEDSRDGSAWPFATVENESGRAIGSTRYFDIRPEHRGLEIGWTWIGVAHQRTAANTECKRLLLVHAFDVLGALRVQLKTDARNVRSQRAIERIGAVREGVLRAHMILPDGFVRDSVMYSITSADWPAVKSRLEALEAPREGPEARWGARRRLAKIGILSRSSSSPSSSDRPGSSARAPSPRRTRARTEGAQCAPSAVHPAHAREPRPTRSDARRRAR